MRRPKRIEVECKECEFSVTFEATTSDEAATETIKHGRNTGHQLSVTSYEIDPEERE